MGSNDGKVDIIRCVVISSRQGGNLLFERFYSPPREETPDSMTRMQWLEALQEDVSLSTQTAVEEKVYIGRQRSHNVTWAYLGELVIYIVGSGIYDHLALEEVVKAVIAIVRVLTKHKSPSAAALLAVYGKVCLGLDEVVHAGHVETLDTTVVHKAIKLKSSTK